jgi:hypothetical protein
VVGSLVGMVMEVGWSLPRAPASSRRVTGANSNDSLVFEALLDDIPPVRTPRGGRRCRPDKCHADKAYDHRRCRAYLTRRGIKVRIARYRIEPSKRLGCTESPHDKSITDTLNHTFIRSRSSARNSARASAIAVRVERRSCRCVQHLSVPAGDALTGERALEGGLDQAVEVLQPVADRAAILSHRSLLVGRQTLDKEAIPATCYPASPRRQAEPQWLSRNKTVGQPADTLCPVPGVDLAGR